RAEPRRLDGARSAPRQPAVLLRGTAAGARRARARRGRERARRARARRAAGRRRLPAPGRGPTDAEPAAADRGAPARARRGTARRGRARVRGRARAPRLRLALAWARLA